jgi:hypothetical protein
MPDTQNSKRFTVYEVQEVTDWRVYYYEIEAPSFEAAIAIVRSGDADPVDAGYHGEPEYNTRALGRSRAEAVECLAHVSRRSSHDQGQPPIHAKPTSIQIVHDSPGSEPAPASASERPGFVPMPSVTSQPPIVGSCGLSSHMQAATAGPPRTRQPFGRRKRRPGTRGTVRGLSRACFGETTTTQRKESA